MSNLEAKQEIGEELKSWLLENTRLTDREIDVYPYEDQEQYVKVQVDPGAIDDTVERLNDIYYTEQIRRVVDERTGHEARKVELTYKNIIVTPE